MDASLTQQPAAGARRSRRRGRAPIASRCTSRSAPGEPPIPWIVSNPIYVRPAGWGTAACDPSRGDAGNYARHPGRAWHVEKDDESSAQVAQNGLSDRARAVRVSPRRRRSRRAVRGARHWRGQGADRAHAPRVPRPRVAPDARFGSGPPSAIGRAMAALDLSRRRAARCDRVDSRR